MPNYCSNKVVLYGDDALVKKVLTEVKGENEFDFNKIIPMPQSIKDTEHGSVSFASESCALWLKDKTINNHLRWLMERHEVNPDKLGDAIKGWVEQGKVDLEMGNRIVQNNIDYGVGDWYDWCIENWGTKWSACEVDVQDNAITFETAWSPSVPVIAKLSEMYPDLTVDYKYYEGGVGLAGQEIYQAGVCVEMTLFDTDDQEYKELEKEFGWGD